MKVYLAKLLFLLPICAEAGTYAEYKVCTSMALREGRITYEDIQTNIEFPEDSVVYWGNLTNTKGKVVESGRYVTIINDRVTFKKDAIYISLPRSAFNCISELRELSK